MIERTARIMNSLGLHARPAAKLVRLAGTFQADVHFIKDALTVNGKSIMGVMMLAAETGSTMTVRAEGADAQAAVDALVTLIETGFGET